MKVLNGNLKEWLDVQAVPNGYDTGVVYLFSVGKEIKFAKMLDIYAHFIIVYLDPHTNKYEVIVAPQNFAIAYVQYLQLKTKYNEAVFIDTH